MKSFKLLLVPAVLLAAAGMAFAGSPSHNSYGQSSYGSYNHSSYSSNYSHNNSSYNNYQTSHYTPSYSSHSSSYQYTPSYSSHSSNYQYTPSYNNYSSNYASFDNYSYGQPNYYNNSASFNSLSYGTWSYDQGHNYYYCVCSYRPAAYSEVSKYVCIYNPQYGNCVYYYNPIQKQYWGRYDVASQGFSILASSDQRSTIAELPQDKFGAVVAQAGIPGSQAGEQLTAPPALPTDAVAALPAR